MRQQRALLAAAMVLGLAACGPASDPSAPQTTDSAPGENPLTAPADYLGAAAKAQQAASRTVDLTAVTRAIQMFQASEGRNPAELAELVTQGYLPALPRLPAGQQFEYDAASGRVRIVTR